MTKYLAHYRTEDCVAQSVYEHLKGVSNLASIFASKLGLGPVGELCGLLHDLGKYSDIFQSYLKSQSDVAILKAGDDGFIKDAESLRGRIDHSTAGGQYIYKMLINDQVELAVGQIIALIIASHHSGLLDCLSETSDKAAFNRLDVRMNNSEEKSHYTEVVTNADANIFSRVETLKPLAIEALRQAIASIYRKERSTNTIPTLFKMGLLTRYLFSCLIDADRLDTANFEKEWLNRFRSNGNYVSWDILIERLEGHMAKFVSRRKINKIRKNIAKWCRNAATRDRGIFTLSVPTGGGKTLASLLFALYHARHHKLDHIVFAIPFTSIIDQNADVAREILETSGEEGRVILEHHSNMVSEDHKWYEKTLTENWDAPIIYTTNVQILEAMFGSGTRGPRRMRVLANSLVIFDEIQTLPIRCVYIFNNAMNFLTDHCGSSVVLCTATQPLLNQVDVKFGAITLTEQSEIIPDVTKLFKSLKRTIIKDMRVPGGWAVESVAALASRQLSSCLVVTNTKETAKQIYIELKQQKEKVFHLSTNMCSKHRRRVLKIVRQLLNRNKKFTLVSTQLIEAGVDVDFHTVIRCLAGLDSIAQAGGRCNRNAKRTTGKVFVINLAHENIASLVDVVVGRNITERIMDEYLEDPGSFDYDLLGPKAINTYYKYYFFNRKNEMTYSISKKMEKELGREDNLLCMLSNNGIVVNHYRVPSTRDMPFLHQSFETANKLFQMIEMPKQGVMIAYGKDGKALLLELLQISNVAKQFKLLRKMQQYMVNVFHHEFDKLRAAGALCELQDTGIFYLSNLYYSDEFGLSIEPV